MRFQAIAVVSLALAPVVAWAGPPTSFTAESLETSIPNPPPAAYDLRPAPDKGGLAEGGLAEGGLAAGGLAEGGLAEGGVAGSGEGPRECPPGSSYGQRPHQPDEVWTFLTSDVAAQRRLCERIPHNGEPIFNIWFWGADADVLAFTECDEPSPQFVVTFHPENAIGEPDFSTTFCAYTSLIAREKVFKAFYPFSGFPIEAFQYKVNFDPPCDAPPGPLWVCVQGIGGPEDCWFLWLSSPEGDGLHYEDNPPGQGDGLMDLDLSLCVNRPQGQAPFCPADIVPNKAVDVDDLIAVIVGWGPCPAPCPPSCPADINGDCQVNVDDLIAVILSWGPCPTPPNDECVDKIDIDRFDPAGVQTIPFDMRGATPSPEFVQCKGIDNIFKDTWWCLRNLTMEPKDTTIRTTIPMLLEVTDGCVCPPGPLLACGDGFAGGVTITLLPGQEVCLRLLNVFGLPNELLKGTIEILNEPIGCPNDDCEDRLDVPVPSTTDFDTTGCTTSTADPPFRCGGANAGNDIWFNLVAPANGVLTLDTFGSSFDTVLKAYAGFGCPPSDDANLGCNDDAGGTLQSQLTLEVSAGDEIKVRIGGFNGATGFGVLHVLFDEVIGPRDCPPESNYGQRPHQADEQWSFGLSDTQIGFRRFDDFDHDGRLIERLVFWGADLAFDDAGNIVECNLENPFFEIAFFLDDGTGHPDKSNPICGYFVRAEEKVRKDVYGGLATAWAYTVTLDPPCLLPPGRPWISIQGAGGGPSDPPDCFFWWLSSPEFNNPGSLIELPDGTQEVQDVDLSFCIIGQDVPPPVNFFFSPDAFFEAVVAADKLEKFFWNFKPDFLQPGAVVGIQNVLDIATHPTNAPGVWFDPASGESLWPPQVDNVGFTSNATPTGPLSVGDVGMVYVKAPAFGLDNNALLAEQPDHSFDIISGPPAGDNHTAFALDVLAFGDVPEAVLRIAVYDKDDNVIGEIVITAGTGQKQFVGILTKDPAVTIGRIDIWDLNGGVEGISQIAAFAQGGPPPCPGEGDCCEPNGTPGCENQECCERVCAIDPFCCETEWDTLCAEEAAQFPQCDCGPPPARDIEFCPPGGCPPPDVDEWCLYQVKELLDDPLTCEEFGLIPGGLICVAICPFPGDPKPCLPNAPDPQVVFQVVGTNCRFLATALDGCEPCPSSSQWRRIN